MEFLTPDEKAQLEQKLQERIDQRPVISKRIAEARALGDLKENADYHAARDDQGLNEAEIRRIEERLKKAAVVKDDEDIPKDIVFLGSSVKLKDVESGAEEQYKLVGEASGNFDADEIEVTAQSPMGESLMKARVGETVKVDLPRGTKRFEVLEIV